MKFTFNKLPNNLEELKNSENFDLTNPHFAAAAFILSIKRYVEDKDAGIEMINFLKGPVDLDNHDKSFLRDRLMDKKYLPDSYFLGATPENNYSLNSPFEIEIIDDNTSFREEDYSKLYIKSGGADSKRPITIRKKGDEHFVWEYSSILLGIVKPKKDDVWA